MRMRKGVHCIMYYIWETENKGRSYTQCVCKRAGLTAVSRHRGLLKGTGLLRQLGADILDFNAMWIQPTKMHLKLDYAP